MDAEGHGAAMRSEPRGIRPEEVRLLVAELAPLATGARIDKIFDLGPHAFLVRLRRPSLKLNLYLTTKARFARFHCVAEPGTLPPEPCAPAAELRELLAGGLVTGVDQPGGDRVVRFGVRVARDGRATERRLVLEMFGSSGRLVVFDDPGRRVRFCQGRGGLEVGDVYRFPDPPVPPPAGSATLPFDPRRLIAADEAAEDGLSFHHAFARASAEAERQADAREERERFARSLEQDIKKRRRLLERLEREAAEANGWERWQQLGDLLKAHLGQFDRGQPSVEVVDYFDPALAKVTIPLDPAKSPADNVEQLFHRARKGRRGREQIVARRLACAAALDAAQAALVVLAKQPTPEGLARAQELVSEVPAQGRSRATGRRSKKTDKPAGPRVFRSREGLEILSGRSARENDRLTLHLARGNDLFFHVARRPGPHVILRVPSGRTAAPESLEDAAFLAGYLSGWRGPGSIDVHWTEVKYVRKPRGSAPGLVAISREREYRVTYRPELLASLSVREPPVP